MDTKQAPRGAGRVGGVCTFTFDDGPEPRGRRACSPSSSAAGYRQRSSWSASAWRMTPARRAAALRAGHDVELHCHRHVRHTELTEAELEADTSAALAEFERAGLGRPRYWRTPWGVRTRGDRACGGEAWAPTGRLDDRHARLARRRERGDAGASRRRRSDDGAIVLMHDALGPGALRAGVEETIGLIAPLAALARGPRPAAGWACSG